jgi:hypothetical protein
VPLAGGVAPAFTQEDIFPVPQPNAGVWQFRVTPVDFAPEEYQIIITPVVRYSGAQTEANTSWIGQGQLDPNFTGNQIPKLGFRTIESAQIPGITAQPFPTSNPKVLVRGWRKINKNNNTPGVNNRYYELEYNADHITGLTGVRIYRRSNDGRNGDGVNLARHKGLGRWEYFDVDTTAGTGNAEVIGGNVVVNLRMPISQDEFNPYYLIGSSTQSLVNGSFSWASKKIVADEFVDIIIVASTSSGASAVGMLLPRLSGSTIGTITTTALPLEITVSAYDSYVAGYLRNITPGSDGSRANVTGSTLWTATSTAAANAFTATTPNRGRPLV